MLEDHPQISMRENEEIDGGFDFDDVTCERVEGGGKRERDQRGGAAFSFFLFFNKNIYHILNLIS